MKAILVACFALAAGIEPRSRSAFTFAYRQERDASCGYSVLSSLLGIYFGIAVSESELLSAHPPEDEEGRIDFARMSAILDVFGVESRGFEMTLAELRSALRSSRPLVVHLREPNAHFALALAATPEGLLLADPAVGTSIVPARVFASRWSGAVLALHSPSGDPDSICEEAERFVLRRRSTLGREPWRL